MQTQTHRIEWSGRFKTGIAPIDEQHAVMIEGFQTLLDEENWWEMEAIHRRLEWQIEQVRTVFELEELLMAEARYPFADAHAKVHRLFLRRLEDLSRRFLNHDAQLDDIAQLVQCWLDNHVRQEDRHYHRDVSRVVKGVMRT